MRRFFCTICGKMKRVQQWPRIVDDVNAMDPTRRVGQCNYHSDSSLRMRFSSGPSLKSVQTTSKQVNRKKAS